MAEKYAVENGTKYEELYDKLLEFYHGTKVIRKKMPLPNVDRVRKNLTRRLQAIAASYPKCAFKTHLLNAIPNLFTFLSYPGMPLTNNDTEREIRDGLVPQRNVRHKLMTEEGRHVFSTSLTFTRTCKRQNISSGRALIESILDQNWNLFEDAKNTPYSLVNSDGSAYSLFAGLDPPLSPLQGAARQDQTAAAPYIVAA